MTFNLRNHIHIRFEPEVDGGTTYAFEHKKGVLVIGKEKMHLLLSALLEGDRELEVLCSTFIDPATVQKDKMYSDQKELMIDLMKLVNADVVQVISTVSNPQENG